MHRMCVLTLTVSIENVSYKTTATNSFSVGGEEPHGRIHDRTREQFRPRASFEMQAMRQQQGNNISL